MTPSRLSSQPCDCFAVFVACTGLASSRFRGSTIWQDCHSVARCLTGLCRLIAEAACAQKRKTCKDLLRQSRAVAMQPQPAFMTRFSDAGPPAALCAAEVVGRFPVTINLWCSELCQGQGG